MCAASRLRCMPAAPFCQALRAWRFRVGTSRAPGWADAWLSGIAVRRNPGPERPGFSGLPVKVRPRNARGPRPAPSYTGHRSPRRAGLAIDPSICPPCRRQCLFKGRVGVSRPIEGIDSCGAVVALRTRWPLACSADASRPRVEAARIPGECSAAILMASQFGRARSGPVCPPIRSPQRADGAAAVEPLDGARHASLSHQTVSPAAGWVGAWIDERDRRDAGMAARIRRCRARPAKVARTNLDWRPAESRPFRPGIPTHGDAGEPSPGPSCRKRDAPTGRQARSAWQTAPQAFSPPERQHPDANGKTQNARPPPTVQRPCQTTPRPTTRGTSLACFRVLHDLSCAPRRESP